MKAKWTIIPDLSEIDDYMELAAKYDAAFEYNDFFYPSVYQDERETDLRIKRYLELDRDRSQDTLHGVFYDIAMLSTDEVIRQRSRFLVDHSMRTARTLGCKGVVFHAGMLAGLNTKSYIDGWISGMDEYLRILSAEYPDLDIYIENTFEKSPEPLAVLAENLKSDTRVSLCLDYAHACLTQTSPAEWMERTAPYIRHMHVNDHDFIADLHLPAGDGKIDFGEFEALVDKYDTDGRILLEVSGMEKTRRSLEYMSSL